MKAVVTRADLSKALAIAGSASSTRTSLPVLQSVRMEAEGSQLSLLGCDGEMWAGVDVSANVETAGAICVQAKVLQDVVNKLPSGDIELELKNTHLVIRQGHSDWKLLALPPDDFPEPPPLDDPSSLTLPVEEMRAAVGSVEFAVSDDFSRPVLTGVLFDYDGEILTLVATDTHRMAIRHLRQSGIGNPVNAIVPIKALKTIKALEVPEGEKVDVEFDGARLRVKLGNAIVVSQLLVGNYPNWQRVMPSSHDRSWKMDRSELIDNVDRALILARDNANRVRMAGQDDTVVISARSDDKGEAKEEVACIPENGDVEIAFNGAYVLDALKSMQSEGVVTELTEPSRPAVFRPTEEGEDHYCVIMPMALG